MNLLVSLIDYVYAIRLKLQSYYKNLDYAKNAKANEATIIFIPGIYETPLFFATIHDSLSLRFNIVHLSKLIKDTKNIDESARKIARYIQNHKYNNVILIGHSHGGLIATKALNYSTRISKVIAIASPFHGVLNGYILRTKKVKELLPQSPTIKSFNNLPSDKLNKITSIYPSFDNQIWNNKGSYLEGATNIRLKTSGHHLILKSEELRNCLSEVLETHR